MIHEDIRADLKDAMKNKDSVRTLVIRNMLTEFTNELVTKKRKPDETLSDEDALVVIKRLAKQRKESITQFKAGNREDLAEKEEAELAILEEYLPEMLSVEEIEKIAQKKKEELGIEDKNKMGILIGAVMKEAGSNADGSVVKDVVLKLLS